MKVLVTGANGFIGRHLMDALAVNSNVTDYIGTIRSGNNADHLIRTRLSNVSVPNIGATPVFEKDHAIEIEDLIRVFKPDIIFHLASVAIVKNATGQTFHDNIEMTRRVVEAAPKDCRVIHSSSATVYGSGDKNFVPKIECSMLKPKSMYAASKIASESIIDMATHNKNISGLNLRFCAIAGSDTTHGLLHDIRAMLRNSDYYGRLFLIGDEPGSEKPFLHIEDAVRALIYFGFYSNVKGVINICQNDYITVKRIAEISLIEKCGQIKEGSINWKGWDANWKGDDTFVWLDNSSAKYCGWEPKYSTSEEAIRQCFKKE